MEGDDAASDAALAAALAAREQRVDGFLRAAQPSAALKAALESPPLSSKDLSLKDRNAAIVLRALLAVGAKEETLLAFVVGLEADDADVLMKYVVKGLATHGNAALLMKVHGMLVEKAGMGCLVRCIVDRRTA